MYGETRHVTTYAPKRARMTLCTNQFTDTDLLMYLTSTCSVLELSSDARSQASSDEFMAAAVSSHNMEHFPCIQASDVESA
jgi:hypothetical protein